MKIQQCDGGGRKRGVLCNRENSIIIIIKTEKIQINIPEKCVTLPRGNKKRF